MDKVKKKVGKRTKIIFAVHAVCVLLALSVVLTSVGKSVPLPFNFSTQWNSPVVVDTSDKYSVVVDNYSTRLTVLNHNWQVIAQNTFDTATSPIDKIIDVTVADNDVYVYGIVWTRDGTGIGQEIVLRCSIFGEFKEVIYSSSNEDSEKSSAITSLKKIKFYDNSVYLCFGQGNNASVHKITWNGNNWSNEQLVSVNCQMGVYVLDFDPMSGILAVADYARNLFVFDGSKTNSMFGLSFPVESVGVCSNGVVYLKNMEDGKIYTYQNGSIQQCNMIVNATNNFSIEKLEDLPGINDPEADVEIFLDCNSHPVFVGVQADYNIIHSLKIICKWIAILYLVFMVIWGLVYVLKRQWTVIKNGFIGQGTAIVCMLLVVVCVSGFYLNSLRDLEYKNAFNEIKVQANTASQSLDSNTINRIKSINYDLFSNTDFYNDNYVSYDNYQSFVDEILQLSVDMSNTADVIIEGLSKVDKNLFYNVYLYDESSDCFYLLCDSAKAYQLGVSFRGKIENVSQDLNENNELSGYSDDLNGSYIYHAKGVFDSDHKLLASYSFCMYTKYIDEHFLQVAIYDCVIIAMVCLIAIACIIEFKNMLIVFRRYKKLSQEKNKHAHAQLVRPLSFLISLAIGADSVLAVLISKDLFAKSNFVDFATQYNLNDFFAGVPITLAAIALVLGVLFFMKIQYKFSCKAVFVAASVMLVLSYLLTAFSVYFELFTLLCIAKFIAGFFCGVLQIELYSMACMVHSSKERSPLVQSISRTRMPASVISILACVALADKFGAYTIYAFAAVCVLFFVVFGWFTIPAYKFNISDELDKDDGKIIPTSKQIVKWLLSPQMLVLILFVILPYAATKGYKSYLFPLYSQSIGLDKGSISFIFALATMFAFILVHPISDLSKRFSNRRKILNGLFALGFIFVLFVANSRVEWAILVMFLALTICKTFGTSFRMLWIENAESQNFSVSKALPIMYLMEQFGNALQVVLLSVCIFFGGMMACTIFGVFCIVSGLIFGIVSYRSSKQTKKA